MELKATTPTRAVAARSSFRGTGRGGPGQLSAYVDKRIEIAANAVPAPQIGRVNGMISKKPASGPIRGGCQSSEKIMLKQQAKAKISNQQKIISLQRLAASSQRQEPAQQPCDRQRQQHKSGNQDQSGPHAENVADTAK